MTLVCRSENEALVYFDWEVSRGELFGDAGLQSSSGF